MFDSIRHSIRETNTPFSRVTGIAALVVACSTIVDAVTAKDADTLLYALVATGIALGFAGFTFSRGASLHPAVGLVGVLILAAALCVLIMLAETPVMVTNNFLLIPMVAVYLGWFYPTRIATAVFLLLMLLVTIAVAFNPFESIWTVYTNVFLVSAFSLFSSGFLQRQLNTLAATDVLTGALNRRGFERVSSMEVARAARLGEPLTLAVIDFDNFKEINDSRGHAAGDQELVDAVTAWRSVLRPYDWISRTGGDEFVLLLAGITENEARATIGRLRESHASSWSAGVVSLIPGEDVQTALRRADALLYANKKPAED